ncbi:iron chelate uptake ABC transporter family permease subunit, partial [Nonomuraea sp. NPDC055795]
GQFEQPGAVPRVEVDRVGLAFEHAPVAPEVGAAVAVLLCAAATAAVGPVAFVGLVGAHCARMLIGADHRWSLPLSMACGAVVLLGADIAGRIVLRNGEIQVAVMTAVVGTPFFVWLARRGNLVRV